MKTSSTKWVKSHPDAFAHFGWQQGYGVFSVGESDLGAVRQYIDNQADHHKKFDFQEEYRALLREFNVTFDERYVWD